VKASPTPSIYRQEMTTVEFLNLTAKNGGKTVIWLVFSRVGVAEDVFFRLDSRTLGFGGSSFWFRKRLTSEGLLLGDSKSNLTRPILSGYRALHVVQKTSNETPKANRISLHLSHIGFCWVPFITRKMQRHVRVYFLDFWFNAFGFSKTKPKSRILHKQ
jgi:hypothetical protein